MSLKQLVFRNVNRLVLAACKRSWRLYNAVALLVEDHGIKIPVGRGMGLGMLGSRCDLHPLFSFVYSQVSGTFVDVGANIGQTLVQLIRYDRTIPYIGFEPLVSAASSVAQVIRANGLQRTHCVYPLALGDRRGPTTIYLNDDSDVSATVNTATRPRSMYTQSMRIGIDIGEAYLREEPSIAIVKVDAEGAEMSVLRGLEETIVRHKPFFHIEILPIVELERNTYDRAYFGEISEQTRAALVTRRRLHAVEIRDFFNQRGYSMCKLRADGIQPDADVMTSCGNDYDFLAVPVSVLARRSVSATQSGC